MFHLSPETHSYGVNHKTHLKCQGAIWFKTPAPEGICLAAQHSKQLLKINRIVKINFAVNPKMAKC